MCASTHTPAAGRYTIGDRLMRFRAYREVVHLADARVRRLGSRLERCYEYDAILIERAR